MAKKQLKRKIWEEIDLVFLNVGDLFRYNGKTFYIQKINGQIFYIIPVDRMRSKTERLEVVDQRVWASRRTTHPYKIIAECMPGTRFMLPGSGQKEEFTVIGKDFKSYKSCYSFVIVTRSLNGQRSFKPGQIVRVTYTPGE